MKKKEKKYQLGGYVNIATGLGQAALGIGQFRRGGRDLAQVDSLEAGMIRSEAARKRMAQQQTDAMRGMQSITRNMATGVEALGRRGTRALVGGVQGLQAAADRATQSYLDKYGTASAARDRQLERADFGETARRVERDRQRAQMLRDAGYKNIYKGASQAIGGGLDLIPTKKTDDVKSLAEIEVGDTQELPTIYYLTRYAFLRENIQVKQGDKISITDIGNRAIGYMGNSGPSEDTHIHLEIKRAVSIKVGANNRFVEHYLDPLNILPAYKPQ